MTRELGAVVVVATCWGMFARPAEAQLIRRQPGTTGGFLGGLAPPDPTRPSQRWTISGDFGGGQDRVPLEFRVPGELRDSPTTPAATAAVESSFWRGQTSRFFEVIGGGFVNSDGTTTSQLRGANGDVRAGIGVRTGVTGFLSASYQPLVLADVVGGPAAAQGVLDPFEPVDASQLVVGPPNGVSTQRWLSTTAGTTLHRNLSPRQRIEGGLTTWRWRPLQGAGLESRSESVMVQQARNLTERVVLRTGYRFERTMQAGSGGADGLTHLHSPEVGLRIERRLSPSRSVTFDVRGGATRAAFDAPTVQATSSFQPVGAATVDVNLSTQWTLSFDAGREVGVLNVVSGQPFKTDRANVQVSGLFGRRLSASAFAGYSRGSSAIDDPGAFESLSTTARVQFGLAHWCGAFASYGYYRHELTRVPVPAQGLLANYGRHAMRVGVTLWLPMYGTF